jgi:hypothetical protein
MAIPTSISSNSNAFWQQTMQAQRAADQASQRAQDLQSQAREARSIADRAESDARAMEMKAGQARSAAAQASMSMQLNTSFSTMQSTSSDVYNVVPKAIAHNNQLPAKIESAANTSIVGQAIGRVINITA